MVVVVVVVLRLRFSLFPLLFITHSSSDLYEPDSPKFKYSEVLVGITIEINAILDHMLLSSLPNDMHGGKLPIIDHLTIRLRVRVF